MKKKQAQNIVEFIFVFPLLLIMTLVIFETALFWQDVNSVYNLNAEINANAALADTRNMTMGSTCQAATDAFAILEKRDSMISMTNPTYSKSVLEGTEPFALYKYFANPMTVKAEFDDGAGNLVSKTVVRPQITLWVDCRSPFEKGITTQIEFYHKTMIMKASIPNFGGGENVVVIPDNVFIASPKLNTLRHY